MWSTVADVMRAYGKPEKVEKPYQYVKQLESFDHVFWYKMHSTSMKTVLFSRTANCR